MKVNVLRKKVYNGESKELEVGEQEVSNELGVNLIARGVAIAVESKKKNSKPDK